MTLFPRTTDTSRGTSTHTQPCPTSVAAVDRTRFRRFYCLERERPEFVRAELGRRPAWPGFASFQVLTRTLRNHTKVSHKVSWNKTDPSSMQPALQREQKSPMSLPPRNRDPDVSHGMCPCVDDTTHPHPPPNSRCPPLNHSFNSPLRPIRVLLGIHLLDADFQPALFREAHVLLLHVLLAAVGQVVAPQVDLVAEVGGAADDREQDYEREEGGEAHGCLGGVVVVVDVECWLG